MTTKGITHDDTNPKSKILFTMSVDTQYINIVVDKETTEVKADDVKDKKVSEILAHTVNSQETEILAQTVDSQNIEIQAQAEQPVTKKPTEDKTTNTGQLESQKLAVVQTDNQSKGEVHVEFGKLTVARCLIKLRNHQRQRHIHRQIH